MRFLTLIAVMANLQTCGPIEFEPIVATCYLDARFMTRQIGYREAQNLLLPNQLPQPLGSPVNPNAAVTTVGYRSNGNPLAGWDLTIEGTAAIQLFQITLGFDYFDMTKWGQVDAFQHNDGSISYFVPVAQDNLGPFGGQEVRKAAIFCTYSPGQPTTRNPTQPDGLRSAD